MKKFKEKGPVVGDKSASPSKRKHESPGTNKGGFKSKEYISDDDSSDSDSGSKKKLAKVGVATTALLFRYFNDENLCFRSKIKLKNHRKIPRRRVAKMTKKKLKTTKKNRKQNQLEKIVIKCFSIKFSDSFP